MPKSTTRLNAEERRERAKKAADTRWGKIKAKPSISEEDKLTALNEAALKTVFSEDIKEYERPLNMLEYVYLIWQSGSSLYKIGVSKNPLKRIKELQSGQGVELRLVVAMLAKDAYARESELHRRYQAFRKNGEWFEFPPLVLLDVMHEFKINLKEVVDVMAEIQAIEKTREPIKPQEIDEFNSGFEFSSAKRLGELAVSILRC